MENATTMAVLQNMHAQTHTCVPTHTRACVHTHAHTHAHTQIEHRV